MKVSDEKLVVVLVGLPGRGKTYIASKLCRYLKWKGHRTRIFNTGMYRQCACASLIKNADFFDPENEATVKLRKEVIDQALDDLIGWLKIDGQVAIYDASNVQRTRREEVRQRCLGAGAEVFFIESYCTDDSIFEANMKEFVRSSPTYQDLTEEEAREHFERRVKYYKQVYDPMDCILDSHIPFLKMIDVGRQMICNHVIGYRLTAIVYFLMNVHIIPRTIYLTRHGESQFNVEGRVGGDAGLSEKGWRYAKSLAEAMEILNPPNLQVWTSTLVRTQETAHYIRLKNSSKREWRCLEEINAGICDGMTYPEIAEKFPLEFSQRDDDKYNYRYPRGESYHDVVVRLEPIMMELERAHNVLVIAHQAVVRCLLAYFLDLPVKELPYIKIPLHTLLKLTPIAYGCRVEQVPLYVGPDIVGEKILATANQSPSNHTPPSST